MTYKDLNINQRINAKNNAKFLYSAFRYRYDIASRAKGLIGKIKSKDGDLFNPTRLMLGPDQVNTTRV